MEKSIFSLEFLQIYWWLLISVLGAALVMLLFVQGGQSLLYRIGKNDKERTMMINVLGHKWELTFTTLVTFGGAFFAAFPLFYSTSFSGAYWVWMLILFCFVVQAVSYEYRSKASNLLGKRTYEFLLQLNGFGATFLLGVAVATFFTGSEFILKTNTDSGLLNPEWMGGFGGLELAFNFARYETYINLSLGLSVFFLARILGAMYFISSVEDNDVIYKSTTLVRKQTIPFLVCFLFFLINILLIDGFAYNQQGVISKIPMFHLYQLLDMPVILLNLIMGIIFVLVAIYFAVLRGANRAFYYGMIGTFMTVFSIFCMAGLANSVYYPASGEFLQNGLTIANSSSAYYTLSVMAWVSLLLPFVIWYIAYVWRLLNRKKLAIKDLDKQEHLY